MKRSQTASMVLSALIAVIATLAGCKVESADSRIRISPDSAVLAKNQSVTLTAHGGYRYEWVLETEYWGALSTRSGSEVVYTSLYEPTGETPVVQVVTVISRFHDSHSQGVAGTNPGPTSYVSHAEAYITHPTSGSAAFVIE